MKKCPSQYVANVANATVLPVHQNPPPSYLQPPASSQNLLQNFEGADRGEVGEFFHMRGVSVVQQWMQLIVNG